MKIALSFFDIFVFFAYFMAILVIGIWFFSKNKQVSEFMDGGRSFSSWILGSSIFSSAMSNFAIMAFPLYAYLNDWGYVIDYITVLIIAPLVMSFMVPLFRKEGSVSAYSYIERRFGNWAALFCSGCYTILNLTRLGLIIYLVSVSVGYLTGYEERWVILIIGGVAVFYSVLGGLGGIIWTDCIQSILMVVGVLIIIGSIMFSLPVSISEAISYAGSAGKFSLGSTEFSILKPTMLLMALQGLVGGFQFMGTHQGIVQRYIAAKSEKAAKNSVWIGGIAILIFAILLCLLGTLLYVYYNKLGAVAANQGEAEQLLLRFIAEGIPNGLKGLVIVGIISAAMSTVDTEINAIATLFYKHVYEKIVTKPQSQAQLLGALYKISIVVGVIPIFLAYGMTVEPNYLEMWGYFEAPFTGSILGLFLLAMIVRHSGKTEAVISLTIVAIMVYWLMFSSGWQGPIFGSLRNPMHQSMNQVIMVFMMPIVGYLVVKRSKRKI